MSEETAKLLIEAMNRLANALAKSGNQTVYHYHYPQTPTYPTYPNQPYYPSYPVWVSNTTAEVLS